TLAPRRWLAEVECAAFSPDGQDVACAVGGHVTVARVATGEPWLTFRLGDVPPGQPASPAWARLGAVTSDGQRLLTARADQTLTIRRLPTGEPQARHEGEFFAAVQRPGGSTLLCGAGTVHLLDGEHLRLLHHFSDVWHDVDSLQSIVLSADGKYAAALGA